MSPYSIVCWRCRLLIANFWNNGQLSSNVTTGYKSCGVSVVEVSEFFRVEGIREHIFRCEKWLERLRYPLQLEKPYITLISFHGGLAFFSFFCACSPWGKSATNGNPIRQDRRPNATNALRQHLVWFYSSSTVEFQSVSPFDCVQRYYMQLCYTICNPRAEESVTREVTFS
jgi:hypothetical protein